jgi:hypothetical protein
VGTAELLEEYWAIGLRNPFRIKFDPSTGKLWARDVGSTKWEEVNLIEPGVDYQYPYIEGREATRYARPSTLKLKERGPLFTYIHTAYDRAVTGGIVYQGNEFPDLRGKYLFADNYSSKLFSMRGNGQVAESVEHIATADQYAQRGTSSVSQLAGGEVLLTTLADQVLLPVRFCVWLQEAQHQTLLIRNRCLSRLTLHIPRMKSGRSTSRTAPVAMGSMVLGKDLTRWHLAYPCLTSQTRHFKRADPISNLPKQSNWETAPWS